MNYTDEVNAVERLLPFLGKYTKVVINLESYRLRLVIAASGVLVKVSLLDYELRTATRLAVTLAGEEGELVDVVKYLLLRHKEKVNADYQKIISKIECLEEA